MTVTTNIFYCDYISETGKRVNESLYYSGHAISGTQNITVDLVNYTLTYKAGTLLTTTREQGIEPEVYQVIVGISSTSDFVERGSIRQFTISSGSVNIYLSKRVKQVLPYNKDPATGDVYPLIVQGSLAYPCNFTTSLGTTTNSTAYDGTASSYIIPISGTLSESHGGTGSTSLANVTVGNATKATQDASGNEITTTYATKSELPTVNNGQLTIQKNGVQVATFTANQSTAVTANITVPTKLSDLTIDKELGNKITYSETEPSEPKSGDTWFKIED